MTIGLTQVFPPKPQFTEANIPDLLGKVYLVTGGNSGIGKGLVEVLYSKNAKVYMAARSETKAAEAIEAIRAACPASRGTLVSLRLDLADLSTIKASATTFLAQETRLDVLFNNAGVMMPPNGSKTAQGYELQLGTNNLGPFLFTQLLTPILLQTAKTAPANSVRIVWVSSSAADNFSPKNGIEMGNLDYHIEKSPAHKYGTSKAGNYLHAVEFARRYGSQGLVSIALNPGFLKTDLSRHSGWLLQTLTSPIMHPAIFGVYTELFAGLSPDVTVERVKTDNWIVPWGRFLSIRKDIYKAGQSGFAQEWWKWTEEQVKPYL